MNRIVITAAALLLASGAVYGQAQADKPAVAPPAAEAAKEVTIVQGPGQASVKEDARHCLEQSTNTDVIKCAEPYLPVKQKKM